MITQLQAVVGFREQHEEIVASKVIESSAVQTEEVLDDNDPTKTKVEDMGLSTRTENALVSASIKTVAGLIRKSEEDLLALDGLGEKGITEIKKALEGMGLSLKA
jgi:DNA-directed RNA polymerase alpha subunit